jgi:hypothetical protein
MVDPAMKGMCSDKSLSNFADIITRCIQVLAIIMFLALQKESNLKGFIKNSEGTLIKQT